MCFSKGLKRVRGSILTCQCELGLFGCWRCSSIVFQKDMMIIGWHVLTHDVNLYKTKYRPILQAFHQWVLYHPTVYKSLRGRWIGHLTRHLSENTVSLFIRVWMIGNWSTSQDRVVRWCHMPYRTRAAKLCETFMTSFRYWCYSTSSTRLIDGGWPEHSEEQSTWSTQICRSSILPTTSPIYIVIHDMEDWLPKTESFHTPTRPSYSPRCSVHNMKTCSMDQGCFRFFAQTVSQNAQDSSSQNELRIDLRVLTGQGPIWLADQHECTY